MGFTVFREQVRRRRAYGRRRQREYVKEAVFVENFTVALAEKRVHVGKHAYARVFDFVDGYLFKRVRYIEDVLSRNFALVVGRVYDIIYRVSSQIHGDSPVVHAFGVGLLVFFCGVIVLIRVVLACLRHEIARFESGIIFGIIFPDSDTYALIILNALTLFKEFESARIYERDFARILYFCVDERIYNVVSVHFGDSSLFYGELEHITFGIAGNRLIAVIERVDIEYQHVVACRKRTVDVMREYSLVGKSDFPVFIGVIRAVRHLSRNHLAVVSERE